MASTLTNRQIGLVGAFSFLGWLGAYVHNLVELPHLTLLSPENSAPALVYLLLFAGWWFLPYRRLMAVVIIVWDALHLIVGAMITVIPFPFLPFYPEQSLAHYLAHIFYGIAQLPLIRIMLIQITQTEPKEKRQ